MIYFLLNEKTNELKIGYSTQFFVRWPTLEREAGCELKLIGTACGGHADEQRLHRRFSEKRIADKTEWYAPDDALLAEIDEYVKNHPRDESAENGAPLITIRLPPEVSDAIEEFRRRQTIKIAPTAIARHALSEFLKAQGYLK